VDQSVASQPGEGPLSSSLVELAGSCFVGDVDSAAERLVGHASAGEGGYVCLCNVHVLTEALRDLRVRRVVSSAAVRFPDGEPVAWLLRRAGHPSARRVGGPDLLPRVLDRGRATGLRHVLVGSTRLKLERLSRVITSAYPGVEVVGAYALPFVDRPEVPDSLLDRIRAGHAQLVWVSLGAPKQELWMARAAPALPGVTLVGVGAAFDFLAGDKRRAPALMQRLGFEWLHRLGTEPKRLTSRYVRSNSAFIWRTGIELGQRKLRAWQGGPSE
jgi:N-acetylglucosaminyldiphosphoundecaprenol N-acetyl-beta-D-mannosaminyltransferase